MKQVAVILCGSGYLDGSEIREAVGVLWALSRHDVHVQCFALDEPQREVVNHLTGESVAGESRNQLEESARIARGDVKPLSTLAVSEYDALLMPGGFGAAKNLCTFALEGSRGSVNKQVAQVLREMKQAGKPIGAACIAPAALALCFAGNPLELTVGATSDASREIEKLGHHHVACAPNEMHVDAENRIVTTPAYMYDDAPLHQIFDGIQSMVDRVMEMIEVPLAVER
jgi:enhancing lycopene biosynthesis protein 2